MTSLEIFPGNHVAIRQLGFGNVFFREWVTRLNKVLDDCLVAEFQKQEISKLYQDVNGICSYIQRELRP
jgi:hypothetical protein